MTNLERVQSLARVAADGWSSSMLSIQYNNPERHHSRGGPPHDIPARYIAKWSLDCASHGARLSRSTQTNPAISRLSASPTPGNVARYSNAAQGVRGTYIDDNLSRALHERLLRASLGSHTLPQTTPHRIRPLLHRQTGPVSRTTGPFGMGVTENLIYTDHGLTGTNRARPCLDQALAAVRDGDTLVVPKLDRLARSVPDARAIADQLENKGVKLALGALVCDPSDPMGKMFFNILATFAEFETDLIRMRTPDGMAIARAKGKLRGKQPKLSGKQQKELGRMHGTGEYSISDLAEVFSVSRPTVYRTLNRISTA